MLAVLLAPLVQLPTSSAAQDAPVRLDRGRFTAVCYPKDTKLVESLLASAMRDDTFPGLPRPRQQVLLAVAPDTRRFHDWTGPGAPEWGAAITFPDSRRIVMQGRSAGTTQGDPQEILRHELAHLALHEYLGDLPPRWFDEGYASYAAHEWRRDDAIAANVALAVKGVPTFDELDAELGAGATTAENAYALAYRAVSDLASLDTARGLARLFENWKATRSLDRAVRASYGMTLDGFQAQWQQRTRRRYGGLALLSNLAIAGLVLSLVVVPLYFVRRRRDRERMAALIAADEAADRAARDSVLAFLLRGDDGPEIRDEKSADRPS